MQNKYVGDIGDFGKYGLLRHLTGMTDKATPGDALRLGVAWYLNDSPGAGGDMTSYPDLEECDSRLYEVLQNLIAPENRKVTKVENSGMLPDDTLYHNALLISNARTRWFKGVLKETEGADVVFLDPDNGIASPKTPFGSLKHVLPYELDLFYERGQSLIIYHHLARANAVTQIKGLSERLRRELGLHRRPRAFRYRRGTARVYFIVPHKNHRPQLENWIRSFNNSPWCNQGPFERVI